jgi:hypothetical protein
MGVFSFFIDKKNASGKASKTDLSKLSDKDLQSDFERKLYWFGAAFRRYSELTDAQKQRITVQLNIIKHNFGADDMIEWIGNLYLNLKEISADFDKLNKMLSIIGSDSSRIAEASGLKDDIAKKIAKHNGYANLIRQHILNNTAVKSAMGERGPFMMFPYYLQSLTAAKEYLKKIDTQLKVIHK